MEKYVYTDFKYFFVIRSVIWFGLGFFGPLFGSIFGLAPEESTKNTSVVHSTEPFRQDKHARDDFSHAQRVSMRKIVARTECEGFSTLYEQGIASWYGPGFHGKQMANGHQYNMNALTVAHRHLPLGTHVCIKNPENGKTVLVTVTDRGPYVLGRVIDLSRGVAEMLGITQRGVAFVSILL